MDFHTTISYPISPTDVAAMLRDERFHRLRADLAGATLTDLQVTGDEVTARLSVDPKSLNLPAAVSRFIPAGDVALTLRERLTGSSAVSVAGEVERLPVSLHADSTLSETSGGKCRREVNGELKVSIPLVGSRAEKTAIAHLSRVVDVEEEAARRYQSLPAADAAN